MPKFGTDIAPTAAEIWAAATRTLTDFSAEEIFDLPIFDDTYAQVSPTSSATADTYGSWAQFSADIGVGKRLLFVVIRNDNDTTIINGELEIGEGASGSEAAVARVLYTIGGWAQLVFPVWKSLTDNARIACRCKDNEAEAIRLCVHPMVA